MNSTQPQLLQVALDTQDVVYTPDWAARDMVNFFQPSGRILEPCKGNGIFLQYLPGAEWCEIAEGKDFFQWRDPVDWLFGNPPYKIFSAWLQHSFTVAENIVYLIPLNKPFNSMAILKRINQWGGIRHMRGYGGGAKLGFPIGFAIGAVHFQRDYRGGIGLSLFEGV